MKILMKNIQGWFLSFIVLLFISSCQKDKAVEQFLHSLPHAYPQKITQFQQADSIYFEHLGYTSIARNDGDIVLYDRERKVLLEVDQKGNLSKLIARTGRGPGEVLDFLSMVETGKGGVLIYDDDNNKAVEFTKQLEYEKEFVPVPFKGKNLTDLYPAPGSNHYLLRFTSYAYLRDKSKVRRGFLTSYDVESESHINSDTLKVRNYARLIMDGEVRGATQVSFSARHLLQYDPTYRKFYTYWTGSPAIAQIAADFDTLRTIPVDLPRQAISQQERDSLKEEKGRDQWKTLGDMLPDRKVAVENMQIDEKGRFWLKLNYRGNTDQWLVMDQQGKPQKVVHLPKGSMLTHVSGHHLGVRLDDITFALYEPVK